MILDCEYLDIVINKKSLNIMKLNKKNNLNVRKTTEKSTNQNTKKQQRPSLFVLGVL